MNLTQSAIIKTFTIEGFTFTITEHPDASFDVNTDDHDLILRFEPSNLTGNAFEVFSEDGKVGDMHTENLYWTFYENPLRTRVMTMRIFDVDAIEYIATRYIGAMITKIIRQA